MSLPPTVISVGNRGDDMAGKTTGGSIRGCRIVDVFDVFIMLVAAVLLVLNIRSHFGRKGQDLTGFTSFFTVNRIEKDLKNVRGVKDAKLHFYENADGGYSAVALLTPWPGNYAMYTAESLKKIHSLISSEAGISVENIKVYDDETGKEIPFEEGNVIPDGLYDSNDVREMFRFFDDLLEGGSGIDGGNESDEGESYDSGSDDVDGSGSRRFFNGTLNEI